MFVLKLIEVVALKTWEDLEKKSQGKYSVKMMSSTCIERG